MANKQIKKLTEEELVDTQVAPEAAQPATADDMAAATTPDMGMVDPNADPNAAAPVEDAPIEGAAVEQPDTFTAPIPGYVPSGWVNAAELASAVAQATGDVEAAQTAPDAQAAGQEDVTAEVPVADMGGDAQTDATTDDTLVLESLTKKELDMIREYRKYLEAKDNESPSEAAVETAEEMVELTDIAASDDTGFDESLTDEEREVIKEYRQYKLNKSEKMTENTKVYYDLTDGTYKPWSGAVDTWNQIEDADKVEDLDNLLSDTYPDGLTETQLNDILWFDSDWVLGELGLAEREDEDEDYEEDDDEGPGMVEDEDGHLVPYEESTETTPKKLVEDITDEEFDNQEIDDSIFADMEDDVEDEEVEEFDPAEALEDVGDGDAEYHLEAEIDTDDPEEAEEEVVDLIQNASSFLDSLLSDDDYEDDDVTIVDDEELESDGFEEGDDFEDAIDEEEEVEEIHESRVPCKFPKKSEEETFKTERKAHLNDVRKAMSEKVIYPAGSEAMKDEVEEYEEASQRRRAALKEFRKSLKVNSSNRENPKFKEALSSPITFNEKREGSGSWKDNRFEEKYEERQQLDYKKLLSEGFLG